MVNELLLAEENTHSKGINGEEKYTKKAAGGSRRDVTKYMLKDQLEIRIPVMG